MVQVALASNDEVVIYGHPNFVKHLTTEELSDFATQMSELTDRYMSLIDSRIAADGEDE